MKGITYPELTRQERDQVYANLKVGDKLARIHHDRWSQSRRVTTSEVIRITPKGSKRLDNDELLKGNLAGYYPITDEMLMYAKACKMETRLSDALYKASKETGKVNNRITMEQAKVIIDILEGLTLND